MIGFTKCLSREAATFGVAVNAIAAGIFDTELAHELPERLLQMHEFWAAAGRMGRPAELAEIRRLHGQRPQQLHERRGRHRRRRRGDVNGGCRPVVKEDFVKGGRGMRFSVNLIPLPPFLFSLLPAAFT